MEKENQEQNKKDIQVLPEVVIETFQLLEEKRKKVVGYIEQLFEAYYKNYSDQYNRIMKNLVLITHPKNNTIYTYDSKEFAKLFFHYWLITEYANPNWEEEGINMLNVLVRIDIETPYMKNLSDFNDWMQKMVWSQNLAYDFKNDYTFLQSIAESSNRLFQILRKMDYLSYNSSINDSIRAYRDESELQRKLKIDAINTAIKVEKKNNNLKHFNDKWKPYRKIWPALKIETQSVKSAFKDLLTKYPNDANLRNISPESFNRAMNKWLKSY